MENTKQKSCLGFDPIHSKGNRQRGHQSQSQQLLGQLLH